MTSSPALDPAAPQPPAAPAKPPQAVLGEMINGYWVTQCLHAAAALGIADRLRDTGAHGVGGRAVGELARATETDPTSLYRLLRALASIGVFAETDDSAGEPAARRFTHTPLSEALRSDVPGSMHGLALVTGRLHMRAW